MARKEHADASGLQGWTCHTRNDNMHDVSNNIVNNKNNGFKIMEMVPEWFETGFGLTQGGPDGGENIPR